MTKKIKQAPSWLGLSDDRTSFVYLPERAEIVRHIFELSVGGLGGYTIAKLLNSKNVPAFGNSKKWDQSTIHNMLSSRATIGEYQKKQSIDGDLYPVGDPVPGYYPAVIEESLFQAAQAARQRNLATGRGRKGQLITNLCAKLPTCSYCGSPVKFHSNGNSKSLICKAVLMEDQCFRFGWSYADFENSLFECLSKNETLPKFSEQLAKLRAGIQKQSQDEIYEARLEIMHILKASVSKLTIASAGMFPRSSLDARIRRNHPKRCFTVFFSDGSSRNGYPTISPQVGSKRTFNSVNLSKSLRLSPRQGTLTALLAEGESLTLTAEKLGMTLATARWHLREIFRRTGVHSQPELVSLAETTCPPTCDGAV